MEYFPAQAQLSKCNSFLNGKGSKLVMGYVVMKVFAVTLDSHRRTLFYSVIPKLK